PALPAAAALVGLPGLSFAVAWFAATLAWYPARVHVARRHRAAEVALCVGVIAALWVYGARRQAAVEAMPTERELELVLVQSNIGDPLAFEQDGLPSMADTVVATYVRMTRQAMLEGPADFVLWPETAVPAGPGDVVFDRIRSLVLEMDTALIFGGYDFEMTESGRWRIFNTLFWMNRSGDLAGRYHKHNLVPLGEHVPFSDRFPFLRNLLPDPGEFSRGPGARVMKMDGVSFTPLICYELLFARYVRRGLRLGGEVLLNVTNDYWFGRYAEPEQHLALARMRAFETGRPIIRVTNTGFSALIDATGRVVARTGLWRPEILRVTLQVPRMHQTPYTRWGEWVTVLFVVVAWGAVAILWKLAR
ncbi:MAG: apolipoprotein N-acyltransferase, partial [Candidatus Krumholzibacteriia bacterium]